MQSQTRKLKRGGFKTPKGKRVQLVLSEPMFILKEKYLTKKGKLLLEQATTETETKIIWQKYGKNRYYINISSKKVKTIYHK
jgi:hypothetical protein